MQGKFAAVINAISILFGGILIVLSIHYFVSTIGVGTKAYKLERTCHKENTALSPDMKAKVSSGQAMEMIDKLCNYLNTQLSGGSIALIIGIVQLIVSLAALITKIVNWIIWVIAHVIGILFCIVAAALILSVYSGLNDGYECGSYSPYLGGTGTVCSWKYHISYTTPLASDRNEDGISSAILFYSIMILFDMIFCIIGVILMFIFRKNTLEGENGILENKVEDVVQKVSSRLLKSSKINNEAEIPAQGAQAE